MPARPRATSARTPHRVPIGLQLVARAFDPDIDYTGLRQVLTKADAHAARILHDPLDTMKDDGAGIALSTFAGELGANEAVDKVAAAIPLSVTHDPRALVVDAVVPYQTAGLWMGLCLGYRLAVAIDGKDGAR